jgi:hypothetical protein
LNDCYWLAETTKRRKIMFFVDEVSDTFSLTLGECIGLLGATTGGHKSELYTPGAYKASRSSGSSCGRRAYKAHVT